METDPDETLECSPPRPTRPRSPILSPKNTLCFYSLVQENEKFRLVVNVLEKDAYVGLFHMESGERVVMEEQESRRLIRLEVEMLDRLLFPGAILHLSPSSHFQTIYAPHNALRRTSPMSPPHIPTRPVSPSDDPDLAQCSLQPEPSHSEPSDPFENTSNSLPLPPNFLPPKRSIVKAFLADLDAGLSWDELIGEEVGVEVGYAKLTLKMGCRLLGEKYPTRMEETEMSDRRKVKGKAARDSGVANGADQRSVSRRSLSEDEEYMKHVPTRRGIGPVRVQKPKKNSENGEDSDGEWWEVELDFDVLLEGDGRVQGFRGLIEHRIEEFVDFFYQQEDEDENVRWGRSRDEVEESEWSMSEDQRDYGGTYV